MKHSTHNARFHHCTLIFLIKPKLCSDTVGHPSHGTRGAVRDSFPRSKALQLLPVACFKQKILFKY